MFYENVSQLLMVNVRRYPGKTAVVHRDIRLTYKEFNGRINRMAHMLLELGVRPGDKVASMFPNGIMLLEIYYAEDWGGDCTPEFPAGAQGDSVSSGGQRRLRTVV